MVSRNPVAKIVFALAAIALALPSVTAAGDWRPRHHQAQRHQHVERYQQTTRRFGSERQFRTARHFDIERSRDRRIGREELVGGDGLPSILPGIGTYAGAISAAGERGNGIYFSLDSASVLRPDVILAPKAKIIVVDFEGDSPACNFEAGVCVIRP